MGIRLRFVLLAVILVCACSGRVEVDGIGERSQDTATTDLADSREPAPDAISSAEGRASDENADEPAGGDAVGACPTAVPLHCGDNPSGNTLLDGRPDEWSGYACTARLESGPEVIYSFKAEEDCQVTVRLDNLSVDLDLLVLDECDPWSCKKAASTPLDIQDGEEVEFDVKAGGHYFVVVDGYAGASGAFDISVDCTCGAKLPAFADGFWEMHVDRKLKDLPGDVQFPTDPLDEEDYEPVEDGPVYPVVVSGDGQSVEVGVEPLVGVLEPGKPGEWMFNLTKGTFAGGRFVVWASESVLQAELTIYGSGVPIVSSARGELLEGE